MLQPDDLVGHVTGEVEKDGRVLVLRRVRVRYDLAVDAGVRETVERVHAAHAQACPVARSIGGSVDITTEIAYRD
jgi:uncharacterized OsmC-like protein